MVEFDRGGPYPRSAKVSREKQADKFYDASHRLSIKRKGKTICNSGASALARGCRELSLIELVNGCVNRTRMLGRAAAARADNVGAGGEDIGNSAGGFFRRLFVNGFEILQNGKSGVWLDHRRELAVFAIKAHDFCRAR